MLGGDRRERVAELLRQELGEVLRRQLDLPVGTLMTITQVIVSPDLEYAKVAVSVLPVDRAAAVFGELERARGRIQGIIHRKLVMVTVPRLRFVRDDSQERAAGIDRLLDSVRDDR